MRLPFLIVLLLVGALAFAVDVWLGLGLVLLFGRAVLAGAHRRPAFGGGRSGAGGASAVTGAAPGVDPEPRPGLAEILPLP